jgi:2-dehydro-3-deoxy-D-arabinonate dehydratase
LKLCRYWSPLDGREAIGLVEDGGVYDLTAVDSESFGSYTSLLEGDRLTDAVREAAPAARDRPVLAFDQLDVPPDPALRHLLAPITKQEVWGTGETYERDASAAPDASPFDRAYHAARPELFFKATPNRVSGPNEPIRARRDAKLVFPEPELALIVNSGAEIVAFTVGNDVTAYDLCDENILYMPQVKIFQGCCALGPAVVLADTVDFREFTIRMTIERDGREIFEDGTELARMTRPFENVLSYLFREQAFPAGVIVMTGLGFDLPHGFTIRPGDIVAITIPAIGTLRNPVG